MKDIAIENINLDDIGLDTSNPLCLRFGRDHDFLVSSIREIGLVNPPLLMDRSHTLAVITGYGRLFALKELGISRVPCRVMEESATFLDCILVAIHDNLATRGFNDVEKSMVLNRLSLCLPKRDILERYMPLLGLSSRKDLLDNYMKVETCLDMQVMRWIASGNVSMKTVLTLLDQGMEKEDISLIGGFISKLRLNYNYQRQLVDMLIYLSRERNCSISDLLEDKDLKDIVSDKNTNRPQKASSVMAHFRDLCYPSLTRTQRRFKSQIAGMNLPNGVNIFAPPGFEAERFKLEVSFRDGKDLIDILKTIVEGGSLEDFHAPWEDDLEID